METLSYRPAETKLTEGRGNKTFKVAPLAEAIFSWTSRRGNIMWNGYHIGWLLEVDAH